MASKTKKYLLYYLAGVIAFVVIKFSVHYFMIHQMEETACPVLTEMIQKEVRTNVECTKVTVDGELAENLYLADAILSNGNRLKIQIQRSNQIIFVTVVTQNPSSLVMP